MDTTVASETPASSVSVLSERSRNEGALRDQLDETRQEISRVDGKASTILAGAGVALGVVLAGLIAGDVVPAKLPVLVLLLGTVSATAALAGIACIGAAMDPRCGTPEWGRARYFAEVAQYDTIDELRAALARDAGAGDRVLHQLLAVSRGANRKYRFLRSGLRLLGAATVLGTLAGVFAILLD